MRRRFSNFFQAIALAIAIIGALVTLSATTVQAKDLTNRLGIGYSNQFSSNLPSIAARYYPDPKLSLGASLGIDTQKDNSKFGFMVDMHRVVFTEDNLNFYMGSGAGLISTQSSGTTDSGFELSAFVGTEFFFTGLENLGFSFEEGIGVTSVSSQVRVRTLGDAGIIFYF